MRPFGILRNSTRTAAHYTVRPKTPAVGMEVVGGGVLERWLRWLLLNIITSVTKAGRRVLISFPQLGSNFPATEVNFAPRALGALILILDLTDWFTAILLRSSASSRNAQHVDAMHDSWSLLDKQDQEESATLYKTHRIAA